MRKVRSLKGAKTPAGVSGVSGGPPETTAMPGRAAHSLELVGGRPAHARCKMATPSPGRSSLQEAARGVDTPQGGRRLQGANMGFRVFSEYNPLHVRRMSTIEDRLTPSRRWSPYGFAHLADK